MSDSEIYIYRRHCSAAYVRTKDFSLTPKDFLSVFSFGSLINTDASELMIWLEAGNSLTSKVWKIPFISGQYYTFLGKSV